jgi:hypothetical protein
MVPYEELKKKATGPKDKVCDRYTEHEGMDHGAL